MRWLSNWPSRHVASKLATLKNRTLGPFSGLVIDYARDLSCRLSHRRPQAENEGDQISDWCFGLVGMTAIDPSRRIGIFAADVALGDATHYRVATQAFE